VVHLNYSHSINAVADDQDVDVHMRIEDDKDSEDDRGGK